MQEVIFHRQIANTPSVSKESWVAAQGIASFSIGHKAYRLVLGFEVFFSIGDREL